jgi:hypothetical protein
MNWDELLAPLEYAYNTSVHSTTGLSPYFMMFGRKPKFPEDLIYNRPEIDFPVSNESYVQQLKSNLAFKFIKFNSDSKIDLAKFYHNRNFIACLFKIGDTVWVRDLNPHSEHARSFQTNGVDRILC